MRSQYRFIDGLQEEFYRKMNRFPEKLRELMRKGGVGQVELSKATGISQSTISGYINGRTEPTLSNLQQLAAFFAVTTDTLISQTAANTPVSGAVVAEAHDHEPPAYVRSITAEQVLDKLRRRNKGLHDFVEKIIFDAERWDAQSQRRKRKP